MRLRVCGCVGESRCRRYVWVGASFRVSFVVQLYITAPSQVIAAFFARWPLGGNHIHAA